MTRSLMLPAFPAPKRGCTGRPPIMKRRGFMALDMYLNGEKYFYGRRKEGKHP